MNFRPKWLERKEGNPRSRLEIDFWFPRLKIAIELQGKQHYQQVGKASGLKNIQRRDEWKKQRITSLGYTFVEIRTNEISSEAVRKQLDGLITTGETPEGLS